MVKEVWQQIVRLGFRLLYNELAWTYDAVSWLVSLGEWRAWQRSGLPFLVGRRVLELGHGPGHMLLAMVEAGYKVVGVDISPYMGRLARRRLLKARQRPPLVQADVRYLPFSAVFDSVLATFPTNYIVQPETLAAVRRLLRGGGRLVIVPAAELTNTNPLTRSIEWLYRITGQRAVPDSDSLSVSSNEAYFEAVLRQAGFVPTVYSVRRPYSTVTVIVADVGSN